ncbi:jg17681, partial [Pararge aegeria aegeria]
LPPNSQVETLRFSNNAIKTYWPDPFSDVPNLKKLSFAQNELAEITPDLFTKIEALEDLDLSFNKITDLNPLDFQYLHHVKRTWSQVFQRQVCLVDPKCLAIRGTGGKVQHSNVGFSLGTDGNDSHRSRRVPEWRL